MAQEKQSTKDFFISYNGADKAWAEWIAWQLEANRYSIKDPGVGLPAGKQFRS